MKNAVKDTSAGVLSLTGAHGSVTSAFSHETLSVLREGKEATLATLRPDGWPQATIVNFVNDEAQVYLACGASSQKVENIKWDDRISLALVAPYSAYGRIFGLSLAGNAKLLSEAEDISYVLDLWKVRHPYNHRRLKAEVRAFVFYKIFPTITTTLDYRSALGM
jgi:general stress protein 26